MSNIYKYAHLGDDFENHHGGLIDYYASYLPPSSADEYGNNSNYGGSIYHTAATNLLDPLTIEPRYHYDLRLFHQDTALPFTQLDYNFWHGFPYNKMSTYNVSDSRNLGVLAGYETWSAGVVAKNSSYRWSDILTLNVPVPGPATSYGPSTYGTGSFYGLAVTQTTGTFTGDAPTVSADPGSYGVATYGVGQYHGPSFDIGDDILTDFNDPTGTHTYFIDILLRNFPAQAAGTHFDLTNSWFDISSSVQLEDAQTDTFQFSSSLHSVNAGGDTYLRFPISGITHANKANIKAVRFRMRSTGGTSSLLLNAIRVVRDDYVYREIDIDTRRQQLARSLPQSGGTEPSTVFGEMYFKNERPRDTTYVVAFNSGHHQAGQDNRIRVFFRTKQNGDRIEVEFTSRNTQSRLQIHQILGGASDLTATPTNTNILTEETNYYLVCEVSGTQVRASIYQANGISLGALVYTTGFTTTGVTGKGLVGFSFEPYNYDFTMQYIEPQHTVFATFQSTTFASRRLVAGTTLYPINSVPVNVISDSYLDDFGDAAVDIDDNGDILITRMGTEVQGGVRWLPAVFPGDSNQILLTGELWTSEARGTYRAALLTPFDSVEWIGVIQGVQPNTWNKFALSVTPNLLPQNAILHIQHYGQYPSIFKLRNVSLGAKTVYWNASGDNGTTWQPFLNSLGQQYTGVLFPTTTTNFKIQAIATSDLAWVGGYELVPHYQTV